MHQIWNRNGEQNISYSYLISQSCIWLRYFTCAKPDSYTNIISVHFNISQKWKSIDINFVTSLAYHQRCKIFLCELVMIAIQICCIWKFYRTDCLNLGSSKCSTFDRQPAGHQVDPWPVSISARKLFSFLNCNFSNLYLYLQPISK